MSSLWRTCVCVLALPLLTLATLECRPNGPVVPKARKLWESDHFKAVAKNLTQTFDKAISGEITAGWLVENSSFSLALVSFDQPDPAIPIWEYHHLSPKYTNGTQSLDRDSQYLIGSISKVFTDLLLLKSGLNLEDPITKYIPELRNTSSSPIEWDGITLRALGSQLSGIPVNYGLSEFHYLMPYLETKGFPNLPDSVFPLCNVVGLSDSCTRADFLAGLANSLPITAPMERPAYSNIAFQLLTYAMTEVTGKNYTELIRDLVAEPLGLKNTYPSPGNSSRAVIPHTDNVWGIDYSIYLPGGGLVSSLSDLTALLQGTLSRTILGPIKTREWLKPLSFAGTPNALVGMPWEIYIPSPDIVPDHPHYVQTYTKSGGAVGYRSSISVIDELGIGLVVLTAGPATSVMYISDALTTTFIPVADKVARQQADQYTGIFRSNCTSPLNLNRTSTTINGTSTSISNSTTLGGSNGTSNGTSSTNSASDGCVTLNIYQDVDSLVLNYFTKGDQDVSMSILTLWYIAIGQYTFGLSFTLRLFPTEITAPDTLDGRPVLNETWRLWPKLLRGEGSDLPGRGFGERDCRSWSLGDWVHFGSQPIDRVIFIRDIETGEIVGMDVPFLRSGVMEHEWTNSTET